MIELEGLSGSRLSELERLGSSAGAAPLSVHFGPFLLRFAREALLVGGQAVLAREHGAPAGLLLTDPEENAASLFTSSREAAQALRPGTERCWTFSELELGGPYEEYLVYTGEAAPGPEHRFRHPVRLLASRETDAVAELLQEVYGSAPRRWLGIARSEGEVGFAVEVDGVVVGAAWVLVAGGHARLHGLTVRAGHRGLGIASDLVAARLLFAREAGARAVLAEIARGNAASRAAAERSGLRETGRVHLYAPVRGAGPGRVPTTG
jgi:RimJ/RimL family protein N-acetyltransferase